MMTSQLCCSSTAPLLFAAGWLASYPVPFRGGKKRAWYPLFVHVQKIFLEFQETVFFCNCFRILNVIWRWSSIALDSLSYTSEEGTALSNLGSVLLFQCSAFSSPRKGTGYEATGWSASSTPHSLLAQYPQCDRIQSPDQGALLWRLLSA